MDREIREGIALTRKGAGMVECVHGAQCTSLIGHQIGAKCCYQGRGSKSLRKANLPSNELCLSLCFNHQSPTETRWQGSECMCMQGAGMDGVGRSEGASVSRVSSMARGALDICLS